MRDRDRLEEYETQGFVILRDVLSAAEVEALRAALQPYLDLELELSPPLRALLGYSIHPPFMGQLAGPHPEKSLADDYVNSLIADDPAIAARRGE